MRLQHAEGIRHVEVPPGTDKVAFLTKTDSEVKKWAFKNAYMLIFLSMMFFITWIIFLAFDYFVRR